MSSAALEKEQALLKKRLEAQLKLPHNLTCADCPSRLPRWASTNLGVFICTNCSGIHRGLGVHISKVRSCALDKWTPELVSAMENVGNKRANEHWERDVPASVLRPREGDMKALDRWIRDKYELRQYAPRNCAPPDGKSQPAAVAAAAGPPVPPPKPSTLAFAQPRAAGPAPTAAAFKLPTAAPQPAPAVDLLGGLDAPVSDWMADFSVAPAAPVVAAAVPSADAWDAFASAPAIPAPPQHSSAAIMDLFNAAPPAHAHPHPYGAPAAGGFAAFGAQQGSYQAYQAAPLDLAAQLAGMMRAPGPAPSLPTAKPATGIDAPDFTV